MSLLENLQSHTIPHSRRSAGVARLSDQRARLAVCALAGAFWLAGNVAFAQDQGQSNTILDPAYFSVDDLSMGELNLSALDPAIDNLNRRIAWRDQTGQLRVATLSARDGVIESQPPDGVVIDSGLLVNQNLPGPQWAYGDDTVRLVYSKDIDGVAHLTAATEQADGTWVVAQLENSQNRFLIEGTRHPNDGTTWITFVGFDPGLNQIVGYRQLDDANQSGAVADLTAQGGKWIPGKTAFALTVERTGVRQAAIYDVGTESLDTITDDATEKSSPTVFTPPETGAEILAVIEDDVQIGLYADEGGTAWTRTATINVPGGYPFVRSLSAFSYRGRSYLLVRTSELQDDVGLSQIWLVGIDTAEPFFRQVTDPLESSVRTTPRIFFPWASPYIVYADRQDDPVKWNLRRANTGLLTQWGYESPHYGGPWALIHRGNRNADAAPIGIADQYEEEYITYLPHSQVTRAPIGPQGNLYIPYFEENLLGQKTGFRFLGSYDTHNDGQEVFTLGIDVTGDNITAGSPLVHESGDFFFAGNDRVGRYDEFGNQQWTAPIQGVPTSFQFAPDGNIALFSYNAFAYIIDPDIGTVYRERDMGEGRDFADTPICLVLGASPLCAYVNTPSVDPFKGVIYNTFNTESGTAAVHAYDYDPVMQDISIRWEQPALEGGSASSVVISSDYKRLYAHDRVGNLVALDADTGAVIWTFQLGFEANASPNVSDNGFIIPGGTQTDPDNYNFIGLVKDYGDHAAFAFQDFDWIPKSAAAAAADDMWALYAHRAGDEDDLHLIILHPERGIVSTTKWEMGDRPRRLTAITLREDGWMFVNLHGLNGFKALRPIWNPVPPADGDADGVPDSADNCITFANADQRDTDGDGIGNECDADLDQDCSVSFFDLGQFKAAFSPNPYNEDADFNGDGAVNFIDLGRLKETFFNQAVPGPGPSAAPNICDSAT